MALTLEQDAIFVKLYFTDYAQDVTTRAVQVKWDIDLATTLANAVAHAALWAAVTLAGVERISVILDYLDTDPAEAGAENNEVAHVALGLVTEAPAKLTKQATLEIPAPDAALHLTATGPGYNQVDITDADLVALFADFEAAGNVFISHGQNADLLRGGYIHHKVSKLG